MKKPLYVLKGDTCDNWDYQVLGVYSSEKEALKASDLIMKKALNSLENKSLESVFDAAYISKLGVRQFFTGLIIYKLYLDAPFVFNGTDFLPDSVDSDSVSVF